MPGQADAIEEHVRRCAVCRQLSEDLQAYEHPGVTLEEDRRIRAKWRARPIWIVWTTAAAVLLLAGLTLTLRTGRRPPAFDTRSAAIPKRAVLALEQAPVRIPEVAVLTDRTGYSRRGSTLQALAAALQPYRAEDYSKAAQQLEALLRKYPESAEAAFYLGVCQLFLNDNAGALDSLTRARSRAGETLADSVTWYLAVALNRAGRDADALRELAALCNWPGEYRTRSCAALGLKAP
jgi:hypothetical protein